MASVSIHRVSESEFQLLKEAFPMNYRKVQGVGSFTSTEWVRVKFDGVEISFFKK